MSNDSGIDRALFEHAPIAMFEEDRTPLFVEFDKLREQGVTDFDKYFTENPHEIWRVAQGIDITDLNQQTVKLWEASSKEEVLQSIDKFFAHETAAIFQKDLVDMAAGKRNHRSEALVRSLKGRDFWVLLDVTILDSNDGKKRALLSMLDITERKEAEEASRLANLELEKSNKELERSNTELERYAYVVSHDLQEPLRMVASYAQLLDVRFSATIGEKGVGYIKQITDGAGRMQRLISDLLRLSRLGAHGQPFVEIDTKQVLGEVLSSLQVAISEAKAEVTSDDLPKVMGDAGQLNQLFQNLVANGIKFRGDKTPKIHVSAKAEGDDWVFSIADNGIGIAKEHHDSIFMIFKRLHGQSEYPGTGLGLAMVQKIVERHGGRIWLESEPGEGTTFLFTMPRIAADSDA